MTYYTPPLTDMLYALRQIAGLDQNILDHADGDDLSDDLIDAILEEAGKLARDVIAPLNPIGDQKGVQLNNGEARMPDAFKEAYQQYSQSGWNAVPFPTTYGGQGLPHGVAFAIQELWQAGSLAFGLCPLLNQGAVEAILHHASDDLKNRFLPNLISGKWTGTMNLTEPQAGSDLSAIRSKAEASGDHFKITGSKIYITYGEHDMAENIIHLVLARLPDAPEGVKGISLFIVPKILENGERNAVSCVSLEHKLGIHASPTAVMQFDDATGYLVGEAHHGLKYMFTMMNNARLSVGLQGVAISERAYQQAVTYAKERVQGFALNGDKTNRSAIIEHADVKRMLLDMRSHIIAMRALTYSAAIQLDLAEKDTTAQAKVDLLTPLVKSWCTDQSIRLTSMNIQIHGGMGYVEETGAAQLLRDARILPIYEGTNGIQANDLVFRKLLRDRGQAMNTLIEDMHTIAEKSDHPFFSSAIDAVAKATEWLIHEGAKDLNCVAAVAVPYLNLVAQTVSIYYLIRTQITDPHFPYTQELRFLTTHVLVTSDGLLQTIRQGGQSVLDAKFSV